MARIMPYFHADFSQTSALGNRAKRPDLPVERFDHRHGLTSLQVHNTVISEDGRLWAATPAGLACYDGVNVRIFGRKHGLINHGLRTLAIHPQTGYLWIGTDTGIEVFDISNGQIKSLWSNSIGTVNSLGLHTHTSLIGSSQGLYSFGEDRQLELVANIPEAQDTIENIHVDGDGSFWIIGSGSGLMHMSPEGRNLSIDRLLPIGKPNMIATAPDKTVFVGGASGFCQLDRQGTIQSVKLLNAPVEAMHVEKDKIWAAVDQSVMTLPLDNLETATPTTHMRNVSVKHICADRFDNIWLSTSGHALLKISNFRNTFVDDFPTHTGHILSIHSDRKGRLIGGSKGLALPNGQVILKNLEIWDVLRDQTGKIWSATHKGLFCTPNPQLSFPYRHEDCRVIQAPCRALIHHDNQLYIASIRGLARVSALGVEEVFDPNGNSFGYVYSLHIGPGGDLWIATLGQGLFRYDGQDMKTIQIPNMANNSNVYAITHDRSGRIYIAHDNLISRRDSETDYKTLYEAQASVAAWSLGWMEGGNLVAGGSEGLIIFDDNTGIIKHRISGSFEDVPWEFTTSRSLAILDSTRLYCGLGSGLRTVELSDLIPRNEAPTAELAELTWRDAKPVNLKDRIQVPTGRWHLKIELSTEWFLDDCQMRYRLDGFDQFWSDYQSIGSIVFTSLPIGLYALDVELRSPLIGSGPVTRILALEVTPDAA